MGPKFLSTCWWFRRVERQREIEREKWRGVVPGSVVWHGRLPSRPCNEETNDRIQARAACQPCTSIGDGHQDGGLMVFRYYLGGRNEKSDSVKLVMTASQVFRKDMLRKTKGT